MGRPKKKGAKKAGELNDGLCRFSFIANVETVRAIKLLAKGYGLTIKDFMADALYHSAPTNDDDIKRRIKNYLINIKAVEKRSEKYLRNS